MRFLSLCCLCVGAVGLAGAPVRALDHAKYTLALRDFRSGQADAFAGLSADSEEVRRAAVDALRDRLVATPQAPLASQVGARIATVDIDTGRLLLAALAEAQASSAAEPVVRLAKQKDAPLHIEAALALAEIDGAQAVPLLAALAVDVPQQEAAVQALTKVAGSGVIAAFIAGLKDSSLAPAGRMALLKAATLRNYRELTPTVCTLLRDEALRVEVQKALLKLARPEDLPALKAATAGLPVAPKAVLERLIAKLEKPPEK